MLLLYLDDEFRLRKDLLVACYQRSPRFFVSCIRKSRSAAGSCFDHQMMAFAGKLLHGGRS